MTNSTAAPATDMDALEADISTQEIVRRASITTHAIDVMPLMKGDEINATWRIATALSKSRMFKDANAVEQAFAKILIGRDLGISATQSMMSIDLVKGAIQLRGVLLLSFVRKHPDYDYRVVESTSKRCVLAFRRRWEGEWEEMGESEFTIEDAQRAKLVKDGSAWTAHPKNMLLWRAGSNGVKFFCPELLGGMPVYVEGELDGAAPAYSQPAAAQSTTALELPEQIEQLFSRATALDPSAWRRQEVAARIPDPNTEGHQAAVDGIVTELETWLEEREPPEAEVVSVEPTASDVETVDVPARLQQRWTDDEEWQAKVRPLLDRYVDLETGLDEALAEDCAEEIVDRLRSGMQETADQLDALDVPIGWYPEPDPGAPTDL